jgi:methylated-DNA-protein-cysteine methyltransferase-like protein
MTTNRGRNTFNARVYELVRAIPKGRVMTYGGIAKFIPPPEGIAWTAYASVRARWVGYAMASCPENVPWQRVINARGQVSKRPGLGPDFQRHLLEEEGVIFDKKGRVDLNRYAWEPDVAWLKARGLLPQES